MVGSRLEIEDTRAGLLEAFLSARPWTLCFRLAAGLSRSRRRNSQNGNWLPGPPTFFLLSPSHLRYYRHTKVISRITRSLKQRIFDNPTVGAALDRPTANPTNYRERRSPSRLLHFLASEMERQAARQGDNSHVFYILPVTTLRTIDLGGKKNPNPLFSGLWADLRAFFEAIMHQNMCMAQQLLAI